MSQSEGGGEATQLRDNEAEGRKKTTWTDSVRVCMCVYACVSM